MRTALVLLLCAAGALAAELWVDPTAGTDAGACGDAGAGACASLGYAVRSAATAGDRIIVTAGALASGTLNVTAVPGAGSGGGSLEVVGQGADTRLSCDGADPLFVLSAQWRLTLANLTLAGCADAGWVDASSGAEALLDGVWLEDNGGSSPRLAGSGGAQLTFRGCSAALNGSGLASAPTVLVYNSTVSGGAAYVASGADSVTIADSTVADVSAVVTESAAVTLTDVEVASCAGDVVSAAGALAQLTVTATRVTTADTGALVGAYDDVAAVSVTASALTMAGVGASVVAASSGAAETVALTLEDASLTDIGADELHGGLLLVDSAEVTLTLDRVVVDGVSASGGEGGLFWADGSPSVTVVARDCSFSNVVVANGLAFKMPEEGDASVTLERTRFAHFRAEHYNQDEDGDGLVSLRDAGEVELTVLDVEMEDIIAVTGALVLIDGADLMHWEVARVTAHDVKVQRYGCLCVVKEAFITGPIEMRDLHLSHVTAGGGFAFGMGEVEETADDVPAVELSFVNVTLVDGDAPHGEHSGLVSLWEVTVDVDIVIEDAHVTNASFAHSEICGALVSIENPSTAVSVVARDVGVADARCEKDGGAFYINAGSVALDIQEGVFQNWTFAGSGLVAAVFAPDGLDATVANVSVRDVASPALSTASSSSGAALHFAETTGISADVERMSVARVAHESLPAAFLSVADSAGGSISMRDCRAEDVSLGGGTAGVLLFESTTLDSVVVDGWSVARVEGAAFVAADAESTLAALELRATAVADAAYVTRGEARASVTAADLAVSDVLGGVQFDDCGDVSLTASTFAGVSEGALVSCAALDGALELGDVAASDVQAAVAVDAMADGASLLARDVALAGAAGPLVVVGGGGGPAASVAVRDVAVADVALSTCGALVSAGAQAPFAGGIEVRRADVREVAVDESGGLVCGSLAGAVVAVEDVAAAGVATGQHGGAVYVDGSDLEVRVANLSMSDLSTALSGGVVAVYTAQAASVSLANVTLADAVASEGVLLATGNSDVEFAVEDVEVSDVDVTSSVGGLIAVAVGSDAALDVARLRARDVPGLLTATSATTRIALRDVDARRVRSSAITLFAVEAALELDGVVLDTVRSRSGGALLSASRSEVTLAASGLSLAGLTVDAHGGVFFLVDSNATVTGDAWDVRRVAARNGGVAFALMSTLSMSLQRATLDSVQAAGDGGLLLADTTTLALAVDSSALRNVSVDGHGGLVAGTASGVTAALRRTTVEGVAAAGDGGVAHLRQSAPGSFVGILDGSRVAGVTAGGNGGVLSAEDPEQGLLLLLRDSSVADVAAGGLGGVVGVESRLAGAPPAVQLSNVTVARAAAALGGGALWVSGAGAAAALDGVAAEDVTAPGGAGGFLLLQQGASAALADVALAHVWAAGDGGALSLEGGGLLELAGVELLNVSSAAGYGGGLSVREAGSEARLVDVRVAGGAAALGAGGCAAATEGAAVRGLAVNLTDCAAGTAGGAVALWDGATLALNSSHILGARAASSGGCVNATGGAAMDLRDVHLRDCAASSGGGLAVSGAAARLRGCTVAACSADAGSGGGLLVAAPEELLLADVEVRDSQAPRGSGGGVLLQDVSGCAGLQGVSLAGNSAVEGGGAYWVGGSFCGDSLSTPEANSASGYGPDQATEPARLATSLAGGPVAMQSFTALPALEVVLLDELGQQTTGGVSVTALSTSGLSLSGQTVSVGVNGSATFDGLVVAGPIGEAGNVTFALSSAAAAVADATLEVAIGGCGAGFVPSERGNECIECPAGTFALAVGDTECHACPTGAVCFGGASLVAQRDYWRASAASTEFFSCPVEGACLGADATALEGSAEDEGCAEGYEGPVCGVCAAGYGMGLGKCVTCGDDAAVSGGIAASVSVVVLVVALVLRYSERLARGGSFKLVVTLIHMSTAVMSFNLRWPDAVVVVRSVLNLTSMDVLSLSPTSCVVDHNFFGKFAMSVLFLPAVVGVLLLWMRCSSKPDRHSTALRDIIVMLLLFFPAVSGLTLRFFRCRDLGAASYLETDYSVQCYEGDWNAWLPVAVLASFAYALGVPAMLWLTLYQNRHTLHEQETLATMGILYSSYIKEKWAHEIVILLYKVALWSISAQLSRAQPLQSVIGLLLCAAMACYTFSEWPHTASARNRIAALTYLVGGALSLWSLLLAFEHEDALSEAAMDAASTLAVTVAMMLLGLFGLLCLARVTMFLRRKRRAAPAVAAMVADLEGVMMAAEELRRASVSAGATPASLPGSVEGSEAGSRPASAARSRPGSAARSRPGSAARSWAGSRPASAASLALSAVEQEVNNGPALAPIVPTVHVWTGERED